MLVKHQICHTSPRRTGKISKNLAQNGFCVIGILRLENMPGIRCRCQVWATLLSMFLQREQLAQFYLSASVVPRTTETEHSRVGELYESSWVDLVRLLPSPALLFPIQYPPHFLSGSPPSTTVTRFAAGTTSRKRDESGHEVQPEPYHTKRAPRSRLGRPSPDSPLSTGKMSSRFTRGVRNSLR